MKSGRSLAMGWYTSGSHPDFWDGANTTYSLVPYGDLPDLDSSRLDGSFTWLPDLPEGDWALTFEDSSVTPASKLVTLAEQAGRNRVALPDSFVRFVTTPSIHSRVPTCTACYLDLADKIIGAPSAADGFLLRFMNDQQGVLLWYLHLMPGREAGVVVATPEWDEETRGETLEEVVQLVDPVLCASSFEEFILRFWIENTIWFSLHKSRHLSKEQSSYLDSVHLAKARRHPTR